VTEDASIADAARQVGGLDILVNSAGISGDGKTPDQEDAGTFRRIYETNVFGVVASTPKAPRAGFVQGPVKAAMPAAGRASGAQPELQRLTGLDQALEAGQDHRPAGRDDLQQRPAGIKPPVIDRQPCHLAHRDKIEPHDRRAPAVDLKVIGQ
jgi:hypothetical protein